MTQTNFDLLYLEKLLKDLKEDRQQEVWIVGNNLESSKGFWKEVQHRFDTGNIRPRFISNDPLALDGMRSMHARIILLDGWWNNKNAILLIKHHIPYARHCRQISCI